VAASPGVTVRDTIELALLEDAAGTIKVPTLGVLLAGSEIRPFSLGGHCATAMARAEGMAKIREPPPR